MDREKRERLKLLFKQAGVSGVRSSDVLELIEDLEKADGSVESDLKLIEKQGRMCYFCGEVSPVFDNCVQRGQWLENHVKTCPKHPMRELEAKITRLENTILNGGIE